MTQKIIARPPTVIAQCAKRSLRLIFFRKAGFINDPAKNKNAIRPHPQGQDESDAKNQNLCELVEQRQLFFGQGGRQG